MTEERERRLRDRVKRISLIGPATVFVYRGMRNLFRPSAESVASRNTRRAFERFFRSDRMVTEYLTPDRLRFYDEVAEIAASYDPASIVDVGCGGGDLVRAVAERLPGTRRYAGIDYARSAIERARSTFPDAEWIVADLYRLDPSDAFGGERFELVLCTEVLEHISEPERALALLTELCAPGGHVLATVPDGAVDTWRGHANFWDERAFARLLEPYGLDRVRRVGDDLLGVLAPGR